VPTGPAIVLAGAALFIFSMFFAPGRGVVANAAAHLRMRRRVARQNLLRTLYELAEGQHDLQADVPFDAITARRAWSPARVAQLVREASRKGWVEVVGRQLVRLTAEGVTAAANIVRTHRLWEVFLIEEAHIAADHVHRDADEIEHVLPHAVVERLERKLVQSDRWPTGTALPPPSRHDPQLDTMIGQEAS
jgi:manganese/zinc/iron transport system permease protein